MTTDLKTLPKPEKQEAAKQLIKNGYSSRKVEDILGIDHSTALLYAQMPTPEEMKEFSTIFDNYLQEQKRKGLGLVYKRILEILPKERRLSELVRTGEFLEGKTTNPTVAVQVNNQISDDQLKRLMEE